MNRGTQISHHVHYHLLPSKAVVPQHVPMQHRDLIFTDIVTLSSLVVGHSSVTETQVTCNMILS